MIQVSSGSTDKDWLEFIRRYLYRNKAVHEQVAGFGGCSQAYFKIDIIIKGVSILRNRINCHPLYQLMG